jgi:prophage tail gpP-like protein
LDFNHFDNQHILQVVGRGLCQDLVDCSAVYKGMQFVNMTAESIAKSLCEDFGITVNVKLKQVLSQSKTLTWAKHLKPLLVVWQELHRFFTMKMKRQFGIES